MYIFSSLLGVKKSLDHAQILVLGVQFKISDEHPHPFQMQSSPRGLMAPSAHRLSPQGA